MNIEVVDLKIVVTGFEAFLKNTENPSLEVIRLLPKSISGNQIYTLELPVAYDKCFEPLKKIIDEIKAGNTYILNLTQATPVSTPLSLKEIYSCANAHYKLRYKDEFVCFSPEKFIQIDIAQALSS